MTKPHRPYPPEFRRQMIELVRGGRSPDYWLRNSNRQLVVGWVVYPELEAFGGVGILVPAVESLYA